MSSKHLRRFVLPVLCIAAFGLTAFVVLDTRSDVKVIQRTIDPCRHPKTKQCRDAVGRLDALLRHPSTRVGRPHRKVTAGGRAPLSAPRIAPTPLPRAVTPRKPQSHRRAPVQHVTPTPSQPAPSSPAPSTPSPPLPSTPAPIHLLPVCIAGLCL